ncbi:MAG: (deoxy)nucleoside triphosphate pyrophosphohydrolase [Bacteroidota bacterium]
MKTVEVVAAIIFYNNKILCVQRGENKYAYISEKFEFPGGKIEAGESREEGIKREIREELKMDIEIHAPFLTVSHQYPDFHLIMHSFICKSESTDVTLTEHISYQWLTCDELAHLDWAGADIPIMEKLMAEKYAI